MELHKRAQRDRDLWRLMNRYAREFPPSDEVDGALRKEQDRIEKDLGTYFSSMVGQPWSYERCPLDLDKADKEIKARKAEERAGDSDEGRMV